MLQNLFPDTDLEKEISITSRYKEVKITPKKKENDEWEDEKRESKEENKETDEKTTAQKRLISTKIKVSEILYKKWWKIKT